MAVEPKTVYWHRELPPVDADPVAEHSVEADSARVSGTIAHRDELWDDCRRDLFATVHVRLAQEIARLDGRFAHVLAEHVEVKRDPVSDEAWLHGRFTYMLYR
jgi:hypothetical protein